MLLAKNHKRFERLEALKASKRFKKRFKLEGAFSTEGAKK